MTGEYLPSVMDLACHAIGLMIAGIERIAAGPRALDRNETAQLRALRVLREEILDDRDPHPRSPAPNGFRYPKTREQLFREADRRTQRGVAVLDLLPINRPIPDGPAWTPFRVSEHHLAWAMLAAADQLIQSAVWKRKRPKGYAVSTALARCRAHLERTIEGGHRGTPVGVLLKYESFLFGTATAALHAAGPTLMTHIGIDV